MRTCTARNLTIETWISHFPHIRKSVANPLRLTNLVIDGSGVPKSNFVPLKAVPGELPFLLMIGRCMRSGDLDVHFSAFRPRVRSTSARSAIPIALSEHGKHNTLSIRTEEEAELRRLYTGDRDPMELTMIEV